MTAQPTVTRPTHRGGWATMVAILCIIGAVWVLQGARGQDDDRIAGTWSARWIVRNPGANLFAPQLGLPQTPTLTIQENIEFSPVSSQTHEGTFLLSHYQGGQLVYQIHGGYRFWNNPLLGSADANQIQFKGVDSQGLPKNWAMVLVSLTPSTMVLKGLYNSDQITYAKVK